MYGYKEPEHFEVYLSILDMSVLLCDFFWVITRRLNFICQHFKTLCLFRLHRRVGMKNDCDWQCWGIYKGNVLARKFWGQTFSHTNTPTLSTPVTLHTYPPMKMEQTECSEKLAHKIQTPGNCSKESIQYSEHGEDLKSRICQYYYILKASEREVHFGCGKKFYFNSYIKSSRTSDEIRHISW